MSQHEETKAQWTVRLALSDIDTWDALLSELRKELGSRSLSRADMLRTWIAMTATDKTLRAKLARALREMP